MHKGMLGNCVQLGGLVNAYTEYALIRDLGTYPSENFF